jgi:hypothetical protein
MYIKLNVIYAPRTDEVDNLLEPLDRWGAAKS